MASVFLIDFVMQITFLLVDIHKVFKIYQTIFCLHDLTYEHFPYIYIFMGIINEKGKTDNVGEKEKCQNNKPEQMRKYKFHFTSGFRQWEGRHDVNVNIQSDK